MRGEYQGSPADDDSIMELPPHARRIQWCSEHIPLGRGTTSACAENTEYYTMPQQNPRNYLRMRGEYAAYFDWRSLNWELPPHARRIQQNRRSNGRHSGTTSACAENTFRDYPLGRAEGNYLRMRGEYEPNAAPPICTPELPPHARRIRSSTLMRNSALGTTSACAENTPARVNAALICRNYLRMRGEYPK